MIWMHRRPEAFHFFLKLQQKHDDSTVICDDSMVIFVDSMMIFDNDDSMVMVMIR